MRDFSDFDDLFAQLHGTLRLQLRAAVQQESVILYNGREIVILAWLAPCAISAMKLADYCELDCSFKALKPYVYSIPLAVKANVGIPLGIVIAPRKGGMSFRSSWTCLRTKVFTTRSLRITTLE
jgi:hypothetical protein